MNMTLEQLTLIGMVGAVLFHLVCFVWWASRQNYKVEALEEWKKKHDDTLTDFGAIKANMESVMVTVATLAHDLKSWRESQERVYERIFDRIDGKVDKA